MSDNKLDIPADRLAVMIGEAVDCGYFGSRDLREQYISEILANHEVAGPRNDYRVFAADQLKLMPAGTIFHHISRGRCWVATRSNGVKFMQFEKFEPMDFLSEKDPWDKPMKLMYCSDPAAVEQDVVMPVRAAE